MRPTPVPTPTPTPDPNPNPKPNPHPTPNQVPSSYEAGKLEYGYLKVGSSGEQAIVWAGSGDLTLSSEVAEAAGGAAGSLSLIKMLYKSFQGEGSLMGVDAYNSSMMALGALLGSGTISAEQAKQQCEAAKQILANINPSFASQPCDCVLGDSAAAPSRALSEAAAGQNGEEACENKGLSPTECAAVGCCRYETGENACMSGVGDGQCSAGLPCACACPAGVCVSQADVSKPECAACVVCQRSMGESGIDTCATPPAETTGTSCAAAAPHPSPLGHPTAIAPRPAPRPAPCPAPRPAPCPAPARVLHPRPGAAAATARPAAPPRWDYGPVTSCSSRSLKT